MITTIIFDLSEVYLHGLLGTEKNIQQKLNIPVSNKELHIPEMEKLFHGKIKEKQYLQALITKHRWNITIEELKKIVRENFKEVKGTREIIELLKKNGYKLGLLSVHAEEWVKHCEKKFDYHKLFDSYMYSFEVEVCKPERKAFELILKKLHVKPNNCLFIDDWSINTSAAKKLGIKTITFKSPMQLLRDLKKLNIRIS